MAMTLYQKAYLKALAAESKTSYINDKYDTQSEAASSTSHWRTQKTLANARVKAYTRKLTFMNGGTPA